MPHREAANVQLVAHRIVKRRAWRPIVAPREGRIDDAALRHAAGVVVLVEREVFLRIADAIAEVRIAPLQLTLYVLRVWLDQQLVRVETMPPRRIVRSM